MYFLLFIIFFVSGISASEQEPFNFIGLPRDLQLRTIQFFDEATQKSFACTSKKSYELEKDYEKPLLQIFIEKVEGTSPCFLSLNSFESLVQLTQLSLCEYDLGLLSENDWKPITYMKQLEFLILEKNNLTRLPKVIFNLTKINSFQLEKNPITEVPSEVGKLTKLKKLVFKNNKLKNLPESFSKLQNLTDLTISRNNTLTDFPEVICKCTSLTSLNLTNNSLTSMSDGLSFIIKLKFLHIDGNNCGLPPSLDSLRPISWETPKIISYYGAVYDPKTGVYDIF